LGYIVAQIRPERHEHESGFSNILAGKGEKAAGRRTVESPSPEFLLQKPMLPQAALENRAIMAARLADFAAVRRRCILTGRFLCLKDKLAHERTEIARRKFGPWREGERKTVQRRVAIRFWSRRKSEWNS